ncbi:MAG: alcohol dehydrogenase, partial [Nocardioides sp.]|nr:alcohol dehydrogenase [Nocardioides sp.]
SRLKTITDYGFTAIDASAGEQTDAVLDLTDWRGADVVVDAVGHPSALLSAIEIVRAGGQLAVPGVYTEASIELPWSDLYLKGVTIRQGVTHFTETMDEVLALTVAGKLSPSSMVSHRMGMSEAAEAYKMFEAREATKIILDPSR